MRLYSDNPKTIFKPFSEYYRKLFVTGKGVELLFDRTSLNMYTLLLYLEDKVEAPAQSVSTSHYRCGFTAYSVEEGGAHHNSVWVSPSYGSPAMFEIESSGLRIDNPSASVTFSVAGVEASGDFIGELLRGELELQIVRALQRNP